MNTSIDSTAEFIEMVYRKMDTAIGLVRTRLGRPLTYAEKVLYGHLDNGAEADLIPGTSYIKTRPDRIALQDATAQMAILQFMLAGKNEAAVPVTVHCDHLIRAKKGALPDLSSARIENKEVYEFLSSASQRYGFGCWLPGAGIIHQVVLEQYGFPGLMMLGTDSHTPNAGGLGMMAVVRRKDGTLSRAWGTWREAAGKRKRTLRVAARAVGHQRGMRRNQPWASVV